MLKRIAAMVPNGRGGLFRGLISIEAERIIDVAPIPAVMQLDDIDLDFTPHVALPGFIDLQINGAFGHDVTSEPSSLWTIGTCLLQHGVTAFLPTVISSPPQQRHEAYDAIRARPLDYGGAEPLGLHIEGPELAPEYAGTHPRAELTSGTRRLSAELLKHSDVVAMVTVAPEIDTVMDSIPLLTQAGVRVSLGHTAATALETRAALDAGASALTHIFNGMGPLHHRETGAAGAGLLDSRALVSLIADEHHLSAEAIQVAWRMAGPGRVCLVTDAMAGMGAPAGSYRIGSETVHCSDAARNERGSLAGSLVTMTEAAHRIRSLVPTSWDDIARITSTNQAQLLGDSDRGSLEAGRRADIAIVNVDLQPVATVLGGRLVFESSRADGGVRAAGARSGSMRGAGRSDGRRGPVPSGSLPSVAIGVDIGGTSFRAALVSGGGIKALTRGATGRERAPSAVLADVRAAIDDLMATDADVDISGIGVGVPGVVNAQSGVALHAVNLGWDNVDVAGRLRSERALDVLLRVEHDVYLAALAEWEAGSGVGSDSMLYVSVGTGVASRLFDRRGASRSDALLAGEMGFVPVGGQGLPLESVASASAMQEAFFRETGLAKSAEEIVAAAAHDPLAAQLWSSALDALAQGLAAAVCLEDPGVVVIGGGVSNAGSVMLAALRSRLESLLEPLRAPPGLVLATHGELSGVVGAALHAQREVAGYSGP